MGVRSLGPGPFIVSIVMSMQTPAAQTLACDQERRTHIMLNKKTVDDLKDLQGKKVLVRCDFNVPLRRA